jgi:hypothetical protein
MIFVHKLRRLTVSERVIMAKKTYGNRLTKRSVGSDQRIGRGLGGLPLVGFKASSYRARCPLWHHEDQTRPDLPYQPANHKIDDHES